MLILDKDSVSELIQHTLTVSNLEKEFLSICQGGEKRQTVLNDYQTLNTMLGTSGVSERLAQKMIVILRDKRQSN